MRLVIIYVVSSLNSWLGGGKYSLRFPSTGSIHPPHGLRTTPSSHRLSRAEDQLDPMEKEERTCSYIYTNQRNMVPKHSTIHW